MNDRLRKEEIETDITVDYFGSKTAYVYTSHATTKRKILKLAEEFPGAVEIVKNDEYTLHANVPIKWIKISPPARRKLTDEAKAAIVERLNTAKRQLEPEEE